MLLRKRKGPCCRTAPTLRGSAKRGWFWLPKLPALVCAGKIPGAELTQSFLPACLPGCRFFHVYKQGLITNNGCWQIMAVAGVVFESELRALVCWQCALVHTPRFVNWKARMTNCGRTVWPQHWISLSSLNLKKKKKKKGLRETLLKNI